MAFPVLPPYTKCDLSIQDRFMSEPSDARAAAARALAAQHIANAVKDRMSAMSEGSRARRQGNVAALSASFWVVHVLEQ